LKRFKVVGCPPHYDRIKLFHKSTQAFNCQAK
jgi:hypothetical protein